MTDEKVAVQFTNFMTEAAASAGVANHGEFLPILTKLSKGSQWLVVSFLMIPFVFLYSGFFFFSTLYF